MIGGVYGVYNNDEKCIKTCVRKPVRLVDTDMDGIIILKWM
jgi:hypothetical protein